MPVLFTFWLSVVPVLAPRQTAQKRRFHGNHNVDKSWHENVDNVQIFPSADFTWLFCQCVFEINTFCLLPFQAPYGAVVLVRPLLMKNRKVISYVEEASNSKLKKYFCCINLNSTIIQRLQTDISISSSVLFNVFSHT